MAEIVFQPFGRRVSARPGDNLLQVAQAGGITLSAVCGGVGVCGDCRVKVLHGVVTPVNLTEQEFLSAAEQAHGWRLACQTQIAAEGEIVVDVPPESLSTFQRIQITGKELGLTVEPAVQIHDLIGHPPSHNDLRGDWERLDKIHPADWSISAPVLADLPGILRAHNWQSRMITRQHEVVTFLKPETPSLGFAVDVGTTGLAAYLIDLSSGETLAVAGTTNPQIAYGEDVMARLTLVMRDPTKARVLQDAIIEGLNGLLHEVCRQAGVRCQDVVDVVAVGNTAMHHLLLALPVDQLGTAPYVPAISSAMLTPARLLGLDVAPNAGLYCPPNVAGFVGGDHLSMLLATAATELPGITISLDIGTNTEISLNANGRQWCCSTASGPAFEGAHIQDGMRAADGAIERVIWNNGVWQWLTINQAQPVGLCGSGILDAVAALQAAGVLTATGAMKRHNSLVQVDGTESWVVLVPEAQSGHGRAITIRRSDVGEVQLAKAAIRAGIKLLVETAGLSEMDIDRIIVAGAFGSYINLSSAIQIGMFPPLPLDQFEQVGNAAGIGAKRLLVNIHERERANQIAQQLNYIELTNHPQFTDRFSQAVQLVPDPWD